MLFLLFIVISPALSMFAAKPSETGVDVVTCKMNKNTDKKDDCLPSCICQKLVWTLEFSPQLRTNTKTTKICEIWMNNELMDKTCAWTCASVANQVYASQGVDPDLCPQIERENAQITGGDQKKLEYKLIETASSTLLTTNHLRTTVESTQPQSSWTIPSFAPPAEYSSNAIMDKR